MRCQCAAARDVVQSKMTTHPGRDGSLGGNGSGSSGGSGTPPEPHELPRRPCTVVDLDAWRRERDDCNVGTVCVPIRPALAPDIFRQLFVQLYPQLREVWMTHRAPGLAVAAVHSRFRQLEWRGWIAADEAVPRALIAGRHEQAELYLAGDAAVSLRHLAIILEPLGAGPPRAPRLRVVDLRTGVGLRDEHGRCHDGIVSDGPVFGSCGTYVLYLLPTNAVGEPWPSSAQDAWMMLPPRSYVQRNEPAPPRANHAVTIVTSTLGPTSIVEPLMHDAEPPLGTLSFTAHGSSQRIAVGARALDRGIMVGRYERCAASLALASSSVSRVHALVVRIGGDVYALDIASTNGCWPPSTQSAEKAPTVFALRDHPELALGDGNVVMRWSPAR